MERVDYGLIQMVFLNFYLTLNNHDFVLRALQKVLMTSKKNKVKKYTEELNASVF